MLAASFHLACSWWSLGIIWCGWSIVDIKLFSSHASGASHSRSGWPQTQPSSSGRPETRSKTVSGAPLRRSCLFLLEGGFVSSLWDAVFSIAQSLSCLEVLSQAGERSYHVRIPWYKLHKTQLICISSKDIYLEIQNLFDKYLLSTYCMPGIIQGTGNACNRLSPCPQGACILISGQEVLGW